MDQHPHLSEVLWQEAEIVGTQGWVVEVPINSQLNNYNSQLNNYYPTRLCCPPTINMEF